jgi:N6-adenosine-specific RNA methylase IME4
VTRYRTIVADPPWPYAGASAPWRNSVADHYPLLDLDTIADLPVSALSAKDAHLYVWAVLPSLEDAFWLARAWGFRPSTMLTWCKQGPGLGAGYRGNTEHLIVARRGNAPFRTTAAGTWYQAPRAEHSRKPDLFIDLIEAMSPGPYLELFARRQRLGWDTWGNEALEHVALTTQ